VSHIHPPLEFSLGEEVGQPRAMIDVEVRHEDEVHILRVDDVEVGERLHSLLARVDPAIHQHLASLALDVDARAAHLVTRAKRGNLQEISTGCLDLMGLYGLVELLSQGLKLHYYLFIINIIIMVFKLELLLILILLLDSVSSKLVHCKNKFPGGDHPRLWIYCTKFGSGVPNLMHISAKAQFLVPYSKHSGAKFKLEVAWYSASQFMEIAEDLKMKCQEKRSKAIGVM